MGIGPYRRKKSKTFSISEVKLLDSPICFEDFRILRAIGKGSFGKVCIAQKKDTLKMYAMKYMNKNECIEIDAFKNVLREIEILADLEHPFLVNLWFTFQDEEDMFMVVDLLLGGDLRFHLQQSTSAFDDSRILLYLYEIGLALDYLRSKGIVHRDIKPENILLDDSGHAHLTDFNVAIVVGEGERVTSVSGTKPYMAPEVALCAMHYSKGYSYPADWWSLGVMAYEMIFRKRPYDIGSSSTVEEIYDAIDSTCLRFPRSLNPQVAGLVQQLLSVNPNHRVSSVAMMKLLPLLEKVDFKAVYNCKVAPSFVPSKKQLNCDPTYELEEMIIEEKPLHKKKKRLSKKNRKRSCFSGVTGTALKRSLDTIEENFIIYNRESDMRQLKQAEKEKIWEGELQKIVG